MDEKETIVFHESVDIKKIVGIILCVRNCIDKIMFSINSNL